MSKRPNEGRGPRSGVRSLVGYLRDRPIGIKLGFIMFVPTLAIVIVGANGLVGQISTTNNADRARTLATLTQYSGAAVDDLQAERDDATLLLGTTSKTDMAAAQKAFQTQSAATKTATDAYTVQSSSQANLPANFRTLLARIQSQLGALPALRSTISGTNQVPLSSAVAQYSALISALLQIRDDASQLAGDSTLSFEMRAASAVASNKEYLSQERYIVIEAIQRNSIPPSLREQVVATRAGQDQAGTAFGVVATPAELSLYDLTVAGNSDRPSTLDEGHILAGTTDALPSDLTVATWNSDMSERGKLLRDVETKIDAQTVTDATTLRDNVERQIIVNVGLLFGMVLIAMLIAWFVARGMNRSLRELKQGALNVAQNGLPQAVARLRDPALATQLTPHQIALQIAEPLPVRSRDEFGQVTEAFNAVHLEAVRTAAEQAALRSSVATMFVNLARRSQILVDRLIGHLDQLERGEENPDRLAELFQLDHLATRMRRNDENLLVLAGADSTRVQREPAALIDVLRAAQSEVEHYTRVEFGIMDRDIEVAAHAVNDLVHLVAELFDNATAFSPPDAVVLVEARRIGNRAVLYVEDRGIGVSPEQLAELNERLATPPLVDVAVSRMMGLVVVARLAHRHGVKVELRPAAERGMIADVLLPTTVLVSRALPGRPVASPALPAESSRMPQMPSMPSAPPRSPFSPPLALESGPSSGRGFGGPSGSNGAIVPANRPGPSLPPITMPSLGGFAANADAFDASARELLSGASAGRSLPSWSDLTGSGEAPNPNLSQQMFGARNGTTPAPPLPQRRAGEQAAPDGGPDDFDSRSRIPRQRPQASSPLDEASLLEEFAESGYPGERDMDRDRDARDWENRDRENRDRENREWENRDREARDREALEQDARDWDSRVAAESSSAAPAAAPPVWPPVSSPQSSMARDETGQLQLGSGALAAAFDMTTEIPRVRDLDLAGAARNDPYAPESGDQALAERPTTGAPAGLPPFADETMELPIFRELESAWFREVDTGPHALVPTTGNGMSTGGDAGSENGSSADGYSVDQLAESGVRLPTGGRSQRPEVATDDTGTSYPESEESTTSTTMGGTPMAGSANPSGPTPSSVWRSPADEGWEAAAAALDPTDGGTTDGGLPRRVPMAQLVPGGVEKVVAGANRRSPDAVRGLLSAYHRGVQRGRQQSDETNDTSESTTGHSSPGGREQEA